MSFPKDFLWGTATSSYQIEGSKDISEPSIWDVFCRHEGNIADSSDGSIACDHVSRFKEDIALFRKVGIKAYRTSFSMSRIMPDGKVSEKGLDFYDQYIDTLLENGIEPWITLYHWDLPYSLQVKGGFLNCAIVKSFREYASVVGKRFSDRVKHWITVNEPTNIIASGYLIGNHAPGWKTQKHECMLAWHNLLLCHGSMAEELRNYGSKDTKIGAALAGWSYIPDSEDNPEAIEAARRKTFECESFRTINMFSDPMIFGHYPEDGISYFGKNFPKVTTADMDIIKQPIDYFGTNIYFAHYVNSEGEVIEPPANIPKSSGDWAITTKALYWSPKFYYNRYQLPVVILENGICSNDVIADDGHVHDKLRIESMKGYISSLERAINDGVKVDGYFHWSIIDNFEWSQGYKMRFGLIYNDYKTQKRTFKDSALFYKSIIESNGSCL